MGISLFLTLYLFAATAAGQFLPQDFQAAHNSARAEVGVGPTIWDPILAIYASNYAQRRASDCRLVNSEGPYGENLAIGSGEFLGRDAVNGWVSERQYYDYNSSSSCAPGQVCGHYTQVVWRNSARCNNGSVFAICNYAPPGNIDGQRPY